MSNCLDNNCHECNDCLEPSLPYKKDKCKDSDQALTKCVIHNGDDGQCVPFVAGESLSSIIKKFDTAVCEFVQGADRSVRVDTADTLPGSLQDKIIDSQYIKWSVQVVGGIRKFQATLDFAALAPVVCAYCSSIVPPTTTSTTSSTTTFIPPTTTTTTSTTTTLIPNIQVQSSVPGSAITGVSGATGYTLPGTVNSGESVSGRHNSFNNSIGVTVVGSPVNKSIVLRKNGVDLQCITVNGAGTYTFDAVAFIITDFATIEYRNIPCAVITSTTTTSVPATTSTTTTVAPTTTTTMPTNVVVQSSVSGTSISTVGGIAGFNLPQSVEAGEIVVGNHTAFTGAISANIFGVVSGAKIVLSRNGVQLQCLNVNGQGSLTFNSFTFAATDTINISFSSGPCTVPASTSTTTTLLPCRTYQVTNNTGLTQNVNYTTCNGSSTYITVASNETVVFCALDGSIQQIVGISVVLLNASCYNCFTYNITSTGASGSYTYIDCNGSSQNGAMTGSGSSVTVCATQGSVYGSGVTITNQGYGCNLGGGTTSTTTTTAGGTTSTTTTSAGGTQPIIYYGTSTVGTTPPEGVILAGNTVVGPIQDESVINWGPTVASPSYYWFAVPDTGLAKHYWYQSVINTGAMDTPSDLFNGYVTATVGGILYKVYITEYLTQFPNSNYYFSVIPHTG